MNVLLSEVISEANDFIRQVADKEKYGDIIVKITLNDGFAVKLEKAYCEHLTKRKTTGFVVHK
ncbi:MAG: hypothetical protein K5640_02475 [Treponema sp.]|nr:hypothetical protein [Treponema sp.]